MAGEFDPENHPNCCKKDDTTPDDPNDTLLQGCLDQVPFHNGNLKWRLEREQLKAEDEER
jgi:hypothetical protein